MAEAVAEEEKRWRQEGKYRNRTRLNVLVMSAQYDEMKRMADRCELTITQAVAEALQVWINQNRGMGV